MRRRREEECRSKQRLRGEREHGETTAAAERQQVLVGERAKEGEKKERGAKRKRHEARKRRMKGRRAAERAV